MAKLGFRTIDEMVGRCEVMKTDKALRHWKADGLDLTSVLMPARKPRPNVGVICSQAQDHGLERSLDMTVLLDAAQPALEKGQPVVIQTPIVNINRTVGTILSNEVAKRYGQAGLPDETIRIELTGSAGQSLGDFLSHGITIRLEGDANDYVGKGLSGGRLIIYPPRSSTFVPEDNILVGNVCLYGATSGEAFFRGMSAERFCVRNSGARSVIEGVGDHGCEYMTGGRVVVLGPTGRNFAAGMSGGIAYIWDRKGDFNLNCNLATVALESIDTAEEEAEVKEMIEKHLQFTASTVAAAALDNWDQFLSQCVRVMPTDFKRVLQELKQQREPATA